MKAASQDDRALQRGLRRLLAQLVRQARRDLQRVPVHPKHAVHDLRTRMKKLPAILGLVKKHVPPRAFAALWDRAKHLRKAFAAQRSAHVTAKFSRKLGWKSPRPHSPPPERHAALLAELGRMERSIGALKLARLGRSDVLRAYVKSYRAGRKCLKACHDNPAPDRLHALRKRVKRLFYESLALHTVPGMGRRIRRSRKLGHLLGEDHDLVTLMGLARRAREKKVGKRIARKRAKMEPRILKLGDKLFRKRPKRMKRKLDS